MMLWDQHEIQPLPADSGAVLQRSREGRERKPHEEEIVAGGSCKPISKMHRANRQPNEMDCFITKHLAGKRKADASRAEPNGLDLLVILQQARWVCNFYQAPLYFLPSHCLTPGERTCPTALKQAVLAED